MYLGPPSHFGRAIQQSAWESSILRPPATTAASSTSARLRSATWATTLRLTSPRATRNIDRKITVAPSNVTLERSTQPPTAEAAAATVAAITTLAGAAVWAADTRYITISGLQELFEQQQEAELRDDIRMLEWDRDHGGLSERDEWLLERYRDDLEALQ